MAEIHDKIGEYLKDGYTMDEIISGMSQSKNPDAQAFAGNWLQNAANYDKPPVSQESKTASMDQPVLNFVEEHPAAIPAAAAAAVGGATAVGVGKYLKGKESKAQAEHTREMERGRLALDQRKLDIEAQKAEAYGRQVGLQGGTVAPQGPIAHPAVDKLTAEEVAAALRAKKQAAATQALNGTVPAPVSSVATPQTIGNVPNIDSISPVPAAPVKPVAPTAAPVSGPVAPAEAIAPSATPVATAVEPKAAKLAKEAAAAEQRMLKAQQQQERITARLGELEHRPVQTAEVLKYVQENPPNQALLNTVFNEHGPETAKVLKEGGLGTASSYKEAYPISSQYRRGELPFVPRVGGGLPTGNAEKGGGESFGKAPPNWMENQRGKVTPSMATNVGLNALGAVGLAKEFKEAKKTGDYSSAGLDTIGQILANVAGPKLNLLYSLMQPGTLNSNEAEELAKRRKMPATIR